MKQIFKKTNRFLAAFLAVAMVLTMLPIGTVTARAETPGQVDAPTVASVGNITYSFTPSYIKDATKKFVVRATPDNGYVLPAADTLGFSETNNLDVSGGGIDFTLVSEENINELETELSTASGETIDDLKVGEAVATVGINETDLNSGAEAEATANGAAASLATQTIKLIGVGANHVVTVNTNGTYGARIDNPGDGIATFTKTDAAGFNDNVLKIKVAAPAGKKLNGNVTLTLTSDTATSADDTHALAKGVDFSDPSVTPGTTEDVEISISKINLANYGGIINREIVLEASIANNTQVTLPGTTTENGITYTINNTAINATNAKAATVTAEPTTNGTVLPNSISMTLIGEAGGEAVATVGAFSGQGDGTATATVNVSHLGIDGGETMTATVTGEARAAKQIITFTGLAAGSTVEVSTDEGAAYDALDSEGNYAYSMTVDEAKALDADKKVWFKITAPASKAYGNNVTVTSVTDAGTDGSDANQVTASHFTYEPSGGAVNGLSSVIVKLSNMENLVKDLSIKKDRTIQLAMANAESGLIGATGERLTFAGGTPSHAAVTFANEEGGSYGAASLVSGDNYNSSKNTYLTITPDSGYALTTELLNAITATESGASGSVEITVPDDAIKANGTAVIYIDRSNLANVKNNSTVTFAHIAAEEANEIITFAGAATGTKIEVSTDAGAHYAELDETGFKMTSTQAAAYDAANDVWFRITAPSGKSYKGDVAVGSVTDTKGQNGAGGNTVASGNFTYDPTAGNLAGLNSIIIKFSTMDNAKSYTGKVDRPIVLTLTGADDAGLAGATGERLSFVDGSPTTATVQFSKTEGTGFGAASTVSGTNFDPTKNVYIKITPNNGYVLTNDLLGAVTATAGDEAETSVSVTVPNDAIKADGTAEIYIAKTALAGLKNNSTVTLGSIAGRLAWQTITGSDSNIYSNVEIEGGEEFVFNSNNKVPNGNVNFPVTITVTARNDRTYSNANSVTIDIVDDQGAIVGSIDDKTGVAAEDRKSVTFTFADTAAWAPVATYTGILDREIYVKVNTDTLGQETNDIKIDPDSANIYKVGTVSTNPVVGSKIKDVTLTLKAYNGTDWINYSGSDVTWSVLTADGKDTAEFPDGIVLSPNGATATITGTPKEVLAASTTYLIVAESESYRKIAETRVTIAAITGLEGITLTSSEVKGASDPALWDSGNNRNNLGKLTGTYGEADITKYMKYQVFNPNQVAITDLEVSLLTGASVDPDAFVIQAEQEDGSLAAVGEDTELTVPTEGTLTLYVKPALGKTAKGDANADGLYVGQLVLDSAQIAAGTLSTINADADHSRRIVTVYTVDAGWNVSLNGVDYAVVDDTIDLGTFTVGEPLGTLYLGAESTTGTDVEWDNFTTKNGIKATANKARSTYTFSTTGTTVTAEVEDSKPLADDGYVVKDQTSVSVKDGNHNTKTFSHVKYKLLAANVTLAEDGQAIEWTSNAGYTPADETRSFTITNGSKADMSVTLTETGASTFTMSSSASGTITSGNAFTIPAQTTITVTVTPPASGGLTAGTINTANIELTGTGIKTQDVDLKQSIIDP